MTTWSQWSGFDYRIGREAGVSKGSLFQYFEDKFDFFAHVAEQASLRIYAEMEPYLAKAGGSSSFRADLGELVDVWIDYMQANPLERAVTAATTMELDPEVRATVRAPVHRLYAHGMIRPLLTDAVSSGQLRGDTDVDALLALLIMLLPHLALAPFEQGLDSTLTLHDTTGERRSEQARRLVDTLFSGAFA